jgi:hypothetical protein
MKHLQQNISTCIICSFDVGMFNMKVAMNTAHTHHLVTNCSFLYTHHTRTLETIDCCAASPQLSNIWQVKHTSDV